MTNILICFIVVAVVAVTISHASMTFCGMLDWHLWSILLHVLIFDTNLTFLKAFYDINDKPNVPRKEKYIFMSQV